MFVRFSQGKTKYNKGQVFPFMIALIVVLIIMAMITANLGKVAIFRTDVSNAADAGALAGASVLSGTLLGYGLTSDMMCGQSVVLVVRMVETFMLGRDDVNISAFQDDLTGPSSTTSTYTDSDGNTHTVTETHDSSTNVTTTTDTNDSTGESTTTDDSQQSSYERFPMDLLHCISIYAMRLIDFFADYMTATSDGIMAWANAKQKALQFAFNNSGVDERPNTTFGEYGGDYGSYINSFLTQEANQTGFSRFMSHQLSGYAEDIGEIEPKMDPPDITITSGYGWSQDTDVDGDGYMEYRGSYPGNAYSGHENYVEVSVTGSIMYPLESLSFEEYFPGYVTTILTACVTIGAFIKYIRSGQFPGPWGWLIALVCAIASGAAFYGMIYYLPVGLTFNDGDMTAQTTNNPITVQVTRHKKSSNLSLWNFQYGNIKAKSAGHAFPENEDITIEPVFLEDLSSIASNVSEIPSAVFNLATITSIARQMMCMGLSFATGYLISSFFGIVSLWVAIGLILYYVIIGDLCEEATEDFVIDEDDATYNGINDNTDEWFNTHLHLFETELVSGFLQ